MRTGDGSDDSGISGDAAPASSASTLERVDAISQANDRLAGSRRRIDEAMGIYLEEFGECVSESSCADLQYPGDLVATLDENVALVESVIDAALAHAPTAGLDGRDELAEVGGSWHEASIRAVRAAEAMIRCPFEHDLANEAASDHSFRECVVRRDLYFAALIESNRLSAEFKSVFSAMLDRSG